MVLVEVRVVPVDVVSIGSEVSGSVAAPIGCVLVCLSLFLFICCSRFKLKLIRLPPGSSSPPIPGVNNDIASAVSLFRSRS